jgi:hypothetical protein
MEVNMRHFLAGLAVAAIVMPAAAQSPKFIKIEITANSDLALKHGKKALGGELPETVEIRFPLALAKAVLGGMEQKELKINGKASPGIKTDMLIDMLSSSRPGDLLLEITTSSGDLVTVKVE